MWCGLYTHNSCVHLLCCGTQHAHTHVHSSTSIICESTHAPKAAHGCGAYNNVGYHTLATHGGGLSTAGSYRHWCHRQPPPPPAQSIVGAEMWTHVGTDHDCKNKTVNCNGQTDKSVLKRSLLLIIRILQSFILKSIYFLIRWLLKIDKYTLIFR